MTYCGEHSLVNEKSDGWVAISLKCRSWQCPNCHPMRRAQLIATAFSGNPNRFITLTTNPNRGVGPLGRAYDLSRAWRNVVKALKRKHGKDAFQYLCVFEKTKKGEPHLHILLRGPWIDQKWLSAEMSKRIGAPIVDIRSAYNRKAVAAYVAKYIGKSSQKFGNLKRYWKSKFYEISTDEDGLNYPGEPDNWVVYRDHFDEIVSLWIAQGFRVLVEGGRATFDRNDCSRPTVAPDAMRSQWLSLE